MIDDFSPAEVNAIQAVSELAPSSRVRVMRKVIERLPAEQRSGFIAPAEMEPQEINLGRRGDAADGSWPATVTNEFETEVSQIFGELTDLTKTERIMVVIALLKLRRKWNSVTSREVHGVLIDAGFELSNIAGFFRSIRKRKPAHLIQISKPGAGRNRYQITDLGLNEICRIASIRR